MDRISGFITLIGTVLLLGCAGGISKERMEIGKKVYITYCQSCHMENGGGVPNMNASLIASAHAGSDKQKLVDIVLRGSTALENNPERKRYQNKMPALASLTDQQIADVLTYIRNSFTNKASAIDPEDVKEVRESKN